MKLSIKIDSADITHQQAKQLNGQSFSRQSTNVISQRGGRVALYLKPDPGKPSPLPDFGVSLLFHYLEEPDEIDQSTYWLCSVSYQISPKHKERQVIVLKAGRFSSETGEVVDLDKTKLN